jgi:hypothetical protein
MSGVLCRDAQLGAALFRGHVRVEGRRFVASTARDIAVEQDPSRLTAILQDRRFRKPPLR